MISWFQQHQQEFSGLLLWDEPLARHTYYQIGGPATLLAIPKNANDLTWLAHGLKKTSSIYRILGLGSNILASDRGFEGVIIATHQMNSTVDFLEPNTLMTGASLAVTSLLSKCIQNHWGGLEFLSGIPGTIGGAITMNAGTSLGEVKDRIQSIEIFSFQNHQFISLKKEQLLFDYRKNYFLSPGDLIWSATWQVHPDPIIKNKIQTILTQRKHSQPLHRPSCGSVFKNPKAMPAWKVIEQLGLRGFQQGDAQFSEKHCNFIINHGHATAQDVRKLIQIAKDRAKMELGITLEEEVIDLA